MHSPFVQPTESHIHAQWEGKKGFERRAGEGKDVSSNSRRRKKYRDLQNGIMVTFSSLILVVSVENVSIF